LAETVFIIDAKLQIRLILFEEFFINLFDMKRVFDPTSHIVPDHKARELIAIYQHYAFTQKIDCFLC
jgi:hypothetical protein